jgi:hypothetical protein
MQKDFPQPKQLVPVLGCSCQHATHVKTNAQNGLSHISSKFQREREDKEECC